ncbi:Uncharacterised protein g3988 [Pycnogonum litorale]
METAYLLRHVTAAVCILVVSASIPETCMSKGTANFTCHCDINGVPVESMEYSGAPKECIKALTIQTVYDDIDKVHDTSIYYAFYVNTSETETLRPHLFHRNMTVISVRLDLDKLQTIPANLFKYQLDNLRSVSLFTPLISVHPPTAIQGLTKMTKLHFSMGNGANLKRFDSMSSKNTLADLTIYAESKNASFESKALTCLGHLRHFTFSQPEINVQSLLDILPTDLEQLETMMAMMMATM